MPRTSSRELLRAAGGRLIATPAAAQTNTPRISRMFRGRTDVTNTGNLSAENMPTAQKPVKVQIDDLDDPLQQQYQRRFGLSRFVRRLKHVRQWILDKLPEPLSEEEQAEQERLRALDKVLRREADAIEQDLQPVFKRLGYYFEYAGQKDSWVKSGQRVKFSRVYMKENSFWFRIDAIRLPNGVRAADVVSTEACTEYTIALERPVIGKYSAKEAEKGCWLIVQRKGSLMGIPDYVKLSDMLAEYPKTADPLTVPLGKTYNGRAVYRSISDWPHLLVAGSTQAGKSNEVNVILCSLINRNTPDELKVILVDLKGNLEFGFYEGIPHLLPLELNNPKDKPKLEKETRKLDDLQNQYDEIQRLIGEAQTGGDYNSTYLDGLNTDLNRLKKQTEKQAETVRELKADTKTFTSSGIIDRREAVPMVLEWLIHEGERRMDILRRAEKKDINSYNARRTKNRLPRILFVADEWADLMLDPDLAKQTDNLMSNIASRMRAVGIHVIIATQRPDRQVVTGRIKVNIPAKFAFAMPNNASSMVVLDSGAAKDMPKIPGRFIYQFDDTLEIQAPHLPDSLLKELISQAKGEKVADMNVREIDEIEIMTWALDNLDGALDVRKVHAQFERRISRNDLIAWMKSWDSKTYEVRGVLYTVDPGRGSRSRRMISANENPQADVSEKIENVEHGTEHAS